MLRTRPSARLLVMDVSGRLLLFRFVHVIGPLAGQAFWATPGGGLEDGETFEDAARRELLEETGVRIIEVGRQVCRRTFVLQLPDGEWVWADERFFLIRTEGFVPSREGWTDLEHETMVDHRWWTMDELRRCTEQVWPVNLPGMLVAADAL